MEFLENIQKLLNRKKHSTHQQKKGEKNLISGLDGLNMREEGTFQGLLRIKV
tara:strand:- start:1314 stop:1469 length:156 start_codon:yes stop_codon:yes gene_type:complete